jgi:WD40 repeat protein
MAREELLNLRRQLDQDRLQLDSKRQQVASLEPQITKLRQDLATAKSQTEVARQKLAELSGLQTELTNTQTELNRVKSSSGATDAQITNLANLLKLLKTAIEKTKNLQRTIFPPNISPAQWFESRWRELLAALNSLTPLLSQTEQSRVRSIYEQVRQTLPTPSLVKSFQHDLETLDQQIRQQNPVLIQIFTLQDKAKQLQAQLVNLPALQSVLERAQQQEDSLNQQLVGLQNSLEEAKGFLTHFDFNQNQYQALQIQTIEGLDPDLPLLLLPVRLETRFIDREGEEVDLLIRIYPDDIHQDSHETGLTANEAEAAYTYWDIVTKSSRALNLIDNALEQIDLLLNTTPLDQNKLRILVQPLTNLERLLKLEDRNEIRTVLRDIPRVIQHGENAIKQLVREFSQSLIRLKQKIEQECQESQDEIQLREWSKLVSGFGPYRAAWIIHQLQATNGQLSESTQKEIWNRGAEARAIPDCWIALGYIKQADGSFQCIFKEWSNPISLPLITGPSPKDEIIPELGVSKAMRWMVDFDTACETGMGIRVRLGKPAQKPLRIDRLIVLGVLDDSSINRQSSTRELQDLLQAHRYTWGFGLVPQGTPTNSTTEAPSGGYTQSTPDASVRSLGSEIEGSTALHDSQSDLVKLERALGLIPNNLLSHHIINAEQHEQSNAYHMQNALWPVTWEYFLSQALAGQLPNGDQFPACVNLEAWQDYFTKFVRARGPLPSTRVGHQPYGLLPVTSIDCWQMPQIKSDELSLTLYTEEFTYGQTLIVIGGSRIYLKYYNYKGRFFLGWNRENELGGQSRASSYWQESKAVPNADLSSQEIPIVHGGTSIVAYPVLGYQYFLVFQIVSIYSNSHPEDCLNGKLYIGVDSISGDKKIQWSNAIEMGRPSYLDRYSNNLGTGVAIINVNDNHNFDVLVARFDKQEENISSSFQIAWGLTPQGTFNRVGDVFQLSIIDASVTGNTFLSGVAPVNSTSASPEFVLMYYSSTSIDNQVSNHIYLRFLKYQVANLSDPPIQVNGLQIPVSSLEQVEVKLASDQNPLKLANCSINGLAMNTIYVSERNQTDLIVYFEATQGNRHFRCVYRGTNLRTDGTIEKWCQVGETQEIFASQSVTISARGITGNFKRHPNTNLQTSTGLVNLLSKLRDVWQVAFTSNHVPHLDANRDTVDQDLVQMLSTAGVSTHYHARYLLGKEALEQKWRENGIDPGSDFWQKHVEKTGSLLGQLGLDGWQVRLLERSYGLEKQLAGSLIYEKPLSETTPFLETENYINWLLDTPLSNIKNQIDSQAHDQAHYRVPNKSPKPLLYLLLRHATLLTIYKASRLIRQPVPDSDVEFADITSSSDTSWQHITRVFDPAKSLSSIVRDLQTQETIPNFFNKDQVIAILDDFRNSLVQLSTLPTAELERLMAETLDLSTYRLDAWATSLATQRLDELRQKRPQGICLGAYGWVENLERRTAVASQGYVHAPSIAHAATAAVLRSGYLSHNPDSNGNIFAIDLSSARVRQALWLLEGIRQGQTLGALLGYRFERGLHERGQKENLNLDQYIPSFRSLAPLVSGQSIEKNAPSQPSTAQEAIAANNVVDGYELFQRFQKARKPDTERMNWEWSKDTIPFGKTDPSASDPPVKSLPSPGWGNSTNRVFQGHSKAIKSVAFSPDGKTIVSGSEDTTLCLWDLEGHCLQVFQGHSKAIKSVAFSPDGKTIVSGSEDATLFLWDLGGRCLRTFQGHSHTIWKVAFSPDGQSIASCSSDNSIRLWKLDGSCKVLTVANQNLGFCAIAFSPDGKTIASGSSDNYLRLWDVKTAQELWAIKGDHLIYSIAFSPDGSKIISSGHDKNLWLRDLDGNLLHTLEGTSETIYSIAFSPDGKTIISSSEDGEIHLWDLTSRLWNLKGYYNNQPAHGHRKAVNSVAFSPDGKLIVSGSDDTTLHLYEWKSEFYAIFQELLSLEDIADSVSDLLIAESFYHAVQGNRMRAGASLNSLSHGETIPTDFGVVQTPRTGTALTHRLLVLFGTSRIENSQKWSVSPRAIAEPRLNAWVAKLLGDPNRVCYRATFQCVDPDHPIDPLDSSQPNLVQKTVSGTLADLNLAPLDVLYLAIGSENAQQSEIEQRLVYYLQRKYFLNESSTDSDWIKIRNQFQKAPSSVTIQLIFSREQHDCQSKTTFLTIPELLEVARAVREIVAGSRAIDARDLTQSSASGDSHINENELNLRANTAVENLEQLRASLRDFFKLTPESYQQLKDKFQLSALNTSNFQNLLDLPANFDISEGVTCLNQPTKSELEALRAALMNCANFGIPGAVPRSVCGTGDAERKILSQQARSVESEIGQRLTEAQKFFNSPQKRLKTIFGEGFCVLPILTVDTSQNSELTKAFQNSPAQGATGIAITTWFDRIARVREGASRLHVGLHYAEAINFDYPFSFKVAQLPSNAEEAWVALPIKAEKNIPNNRLSITAHVPVEITGSVELAGLLIDDWVEVVPSKSETTGITFHYDAPGSCAPQAALLAVSPDPKQAWNLESLETIIQETLEWTKLRAVDPEVLRNLGVGHFIPALHFAYTEDWENIASEFTPQNT